MPQPKRESTTIRLSEDERADMEEKMRQYGYEEMSPFVRFAVRQLAKKK